MNTTMAPLDQGRQDALQDLRQRQELVHIRRGGFGGNNLRDSSSGGDGSKSNGNGNKDNHDSSPNDNPHPDQHPAATTSITVPTTVVVVSTTSGSSPSSASSAQSLAAAASTTTDPTATFISSFFPTTTSLDLSATPFSSLVDSSSEPRKGLNTDYPPASLPPSTTTYEAKTMDGSTSATALAETAASAPTSKTIADQPSNHHNKHDNLSPLAEHLLIAAGAIGAFIIVLAGVYLIVRIKKAGRFPVFRNRQFRKGGKRGLYGFWKNDRNTISDAPPRYSGPGEYYGKNAEEKNIPSQRQLDAFFSPIAIPPLAKTGATLSRADSQRQLLVREALLDNPAPFGYSPAPQTTTESATENFYGVKMNSLATTQNIQLSRQPSGNTMNTQTSTQNVQLSRQPSDPYGNTMNTMNTQTSTQNVQLSRNAPGVYDPAQREGNHLSYLSSLSSGFGDGLIIPDESGLPNGNTRFSRRQSRNPAASRFSWATSVPQTPRLKGDRDTVYTNTSVESAPRFRTINSWVAQQTSRVERKRQSDKEIPDMPDIPLQLQIGADHQRKPSEDPAFMHHPGQELVISRGSRVPSEILDKKIGVARS